MRSPLVAITWEIWAAHRRSWVMILAALVGFALLVRLLPESAQKSEAVRELSMIPAVLMLCLAMVIFNFTETNPRKGFAGFPQRLFTAPVRTWFLVGVPMLCGMVSVVGLYIAWAELVFHPAGLQLLVRWPATLLAAGVVFYQTIVWCLSGFRITRLLVLGFAMTYLVAVGFIPFIPPNLRGTWTEERLTGILAGLMVGAYAASVIAVGSQRRGGGQGWAWRRVLVQSVIDAVPHWRWNLSSSNRALLWMEWRRSGLVLPAAVLFTLLLIMGPVSWLAGHGPKATSLAVSWISILPILLAIPVSQGLAKPDFWSLELALSPFLSARPINAGQIVAAKLKSAAISTLVAWGLVLTLTPLWLHLYCDTEYLHDFWGMFRNLYAPFSLWAIPLLIVLAAMLLTWSLLVGSIWRGFSGRPWFFYALAAVSIAVFLAGLIFCAWWLDPDEDHGSPFIDMLPFIPWVLAALIICKCWMATWALRVVHQKRLATGQAVVGHLCSWAVATGCFIALAWLISPEVDWLRYLLILAALLIVPLARIAAAPLAVAWNRHR